MSEKIRGVFGGIFSFFLIRNTYNRRKDVILTFAVWYMAVFILRMFCAGLSLDFDSVKFTVDSPSISESVAALGLIFGYTTKRKNDLEFSNGVSDEAGSV